MLPMVPRILLTGYADKENAIEAINNVGLYQYIQKPWDNDDLKLAIRNGLEKTTLLYKLEEKIREVERAQRELNDIQKDILRVFA
jgi:response regulator RpfG family c-di-GMP phosphodiesterase